MLNKRRNNLAWLLILPSAAVMMVTAIIPMMAVINYALQDSFAGDQFIWVGSHWFSDTIRSPQFLGAFGRSLLFTGIVLCIQIPLGVLIALKLPPGGPWSRLYLIAFSLPLLTPWIVVGFVWKIVIDPAMGIIGVPLSLVGVSIDTNNVLGAWIAIILMDVWHWTGLVIILSYAGLSAIPASYYQAARIDGASRWQTFRHVQLPKLRRVLLIAGLIRFMDSFMIYIEPFMVTRGGPHVSTTFLSMDLLQAATKQFDLGRAGAMSLVYFLIMISVSWALFTVLRGQSGEHRQSD